MQIQTIKMEKNENDNQEEKENKMESCKIEKTIGSKLNGGSFLIYIKNMR